MKVLCGNEFIFAVIELIGAGLEGEEVAMEGEGEGSVVVAVAVTVAVDDGAGRMDELSGKVDDGLA